MTVSWFFDTQCQEAQGGKQTVLSDSLYESIWPVCLLFKYMYSERDIIQMFSIWERYPLLRRINSDHGLTLSVDYIIWPVEEMLT